MAWLYAVFLFLLCTAVGTPSVCSGPQPGADDLTVKAIELYQNGKMDLSRQTFEKAAVLNPEKLAPPYYLGMIHLQNGDREAAVSQWRTYVAKAPVSDEAQYLRRSITLLERLEATKEARRAVAAETALMAHPMDKNTVAVAAFTTLGYEDLGPLGKGMAAMISADLSLFKSLKVVERVKLQALLAEMSSDTSGVVDEKSASEVGRSLEAGYVAGGNLAAFQGGGLQITSVLHNVSRNTPETAQKAIGPLEKFYQLEKAIARKIAGDLGRDIHHAPQGFYKIHTRSLAAFSAYACGLDYFDEDNFDEARVMFQEALTEDPDFELAETALAATPFGTMLLMNESQILSNALIDAPEATAVATSGPLSAKSTGGGRMNTAAASAIVGGTVAAGGAMVAATASTETNKDEDPAALQVALEGQWRGTWTNDRYEGGTLLLDLRRDRDNLTGNIALSGLECFFSGSVFGSHADGRLHLTVSSSDGDALLSIVRTTNDDMAGQLDFTNGSCSGLALNVDISKTGSALVHW